ncbi:hypothetical protein PACILC2_24210 [Paenibacillus cisolokensis]|uniref:Metallo-beta-lactamase domain-containing protein n=1 Tax=Paenibacillus cisolokensis TaxID=1658519 RepID=A0ABQ4N6P1_9BACL|nr:MBL fold metallo-hydrolase [Paenibacillus cisolokensis]GIQ63853.1 hypothetical protein PACILC2_24210 [Paenibacillus cisolokensis]
MIEVKVTQISEHIWSIKLWLIIPIHVWLVKEKNGITLVDTGVAMMAKGIVKAIERLQAGPLLRIVLTHGHPDHIGGLKRICSRIRFRHMLTASKFLIWKENFPTDKVKNRLLMCKKGPFNRLARMSADNCKP